MGNEWRRAIRTAVPAAVLASLIIAGLAHAHAYIESSVPEDEAVLAESPAEVRIRYMEPIETRLSTLTLTDAEGRPVPGTSQTSDGDLVLILSLPHLPGGNYSARSQVLARDGHVTEETIRFSVETEPDEPAPAEPTPTPGETTAAPAPATTQAPTTAPTTGDGEEHASHREEHASHRGGGMDAVLKTLQLIGAILLTGGAVFLVLIWRPAVAILPPGQRGALDLAVAHRVRAGAAIGFPLVAAAGSLDLLHLSATLARSPLFSDAAISNLAPVVLQSELGPIAVLRILLAMGVWVAVRTVVRTPRPGAHGVAVIPNLAAAAAGAGLLATFSLTGHAVTAPVARDLAILADLAHFLAAAAWGGGLYYFALLPWGELAGGERLPIVHRTVWRFSLMGLMAIAVLAGTGLFLSTLRIHGPIDLVETPYGLALTRKLVLLAGILGIAAVNLFAIRPRVARAVTGEEAAPHPGRTVLLLRRLVRAEAIVTLAVMTAAGFLSTTPPPDGPQPPVQISVTTSNSHHTSFVGGVEVAQNRNKNKVTGDVPGVSAPSTVRSGNGHHAGRGDRPGQGRVAGSA